MREPERLLLLGGLQQLRLDEQMLAERLERYAELVEKFNPRYRLVADSERLVTHHLLDSVAAVPVLRGLGPAARLMDVGSGAGLPGIPLALCLPEWQVTLVERSARRARFLLLVRKELQLANCTVIASSLEQLGQMAADEPQDVIVFRAVAETNSMLADLRVLGRHRAVLHQGTVVVAFKGRRDRLEQELVMVEQPYEIHELSVPFLFRERHLLLLHGPWEGTRRGANDGLAADS